MRSGFASRASAPCPTNSSAVVQLSTRATARARSSVNTGRAGANQARSVRRSITPQQQRQRDPVVAGAFHELPNRQSGEWPQQRGPERPDAHVEKCCAPGREQHDQPDGDVDSPNEGHRGPREVGSQANDGEKRDPILLPDDPEGTMADEAHRCRDAEAVPRRDSGPTCGGQGHRRDRTFREHAWASARSVQPTRRLPSAPRARYLL